MKKLIPATLSLLLLSIAAVSAQEKVALREPLVRFGVGYRYSLCLTESLKVKTDVINRKKHQTPDFIRGGTLHLEGTVRVAPQWRMGAGIGFGSYDYENYKTFMAYAKAERLYGKGRHRWFNYADLGASFYMDNATGGTASLGGGFRWSLTRRTRMDFTAGLEWMNIVGEAYAIDTGEVFRRGGRMNRLGLTFGVAMHF